MSWKIGTAQRHRIRRRLREQHGDNCHWCGKPMCFEAKNDLEPVRRSQTA